jgi:hypothetical protein
MIVPLRNVPRWVGIEASVSETGVSASGQSNLLLLHVADQNHIGVGVAADKAELLAIE